MDKELLEALDEYCAKCTKVLGSMADGHYLAGRNNKEYRELMAAGAKLDEAIKKEKAPKPEPYS